jgi:hypothetical protein
MKKSMLTFAAGCVLMSSPLALRVAVAQSDTPKFEAGIQYSVLNFDTFALSERRRNESGVGGRFTYNFSKYVAAEAQLDFFPGQDVEHIGSISLVQYGHKTLGVFGAKAGVRGKRAGVFGKARPGFIHFSKVPGFACIAIVGPCRQPGKTNFAFDVGGVVEYYPARRLVVRFDAGDTMIHDQSGFFGTRHSFQFSSGVGLRF